VDWYALGMPFLIHTKTFDRSFSILSEKLKRKTLERIRLLLDDEYAEILNNHPLHGEYGGCRSINITGDFRLIYTKIDASTYRLLNIGRHGQLYE
jgi:addiction module RelE/StbE family toxin